MSIKIRSLTPKSIIYFLSVFVILISCGSKQDVVYFQGVDIVGSSTSINNYVPLFLPDDMLTITVSALDQDAARPFNLPMITFGSAGTSAIQQRQETYLIDTDGNIDFPVLGKIKMAGLSRIQGTELIKEMLQEYIKNPIVNIRIVNFKVTVLGEVANPGSFTIPYERITIIEALGLAGDMTIQAERKNVLVIREEKGKKTYNRIDMTSETVFNSPVYYLIQNDVIYVEPNNSRVKSSTVGPNVGATLGVISALLTATALVINLTK